MGSGGGVGEPFGECFCGGLRWWSGSRGVCS